MRVIIGYGNELRGEDAFGHEVIKELQKAPLKDTKLLSVHQLTPERVLELLSADEVVFIDTCYDEESHYALASSLNEQHSLNLTHHIAPKTIMYMLKTLYNKHPTFSIYSMLSSNFDKIVDKKKYKECVKLVATCLILQSSN